MALCLLFIARRANWFVPSSKPAIAASNLRRSDTNLDTSQLMWVIMAAPDPPAPVSTSASSRGLGTSLRLDVIAIQDAWLEVETDGRFNCAKLIKAEQTLSFEASQRIRIMTGNAFGVELRFNGQPVATNGAKRRVRTLEFTTEGPRELNSGQSVAKS